MKKYYQIPEEDYLRIHFVRPRFKSNIENVLLYIANECCKIESCTCREYAARINNSIRLFPGNISSTQKTINNWRTEISALCAFYNEDKVANKTETSKLSFFLNENQDLTQFFKFLMISFQFPGGHIKPLDNIDLITNRVRFKPAQYIIKVLMAGNELLAASGSEKEMSISEEEATYCIFNDLQVTTGKRTPREVAELILRNRNNKVLYYNRKDPRNFNSKGSPRTKRDVVRYAGDVMDYMEIASLLERRMDGYFILKPNALSDLKTFVEDSSYFDGYDRFYGSKSIKPSMLAPIESEWFSYVNNLVDPNKFKTDIRSFIESSEVNVVFDNRISEIIESEKTTTKDIGNIGESIIYSHEKQRLKLAGYENLLHLIAIVDSPSYHPGFDIDSLEGDGTNHHRYIEVKTTISRQKINLFSFHMSPNEWAVADTNREHYCVYRLMLSAADKTLYILRNPVALYKSDKIDAVPRNGMEISFDSSKFSPENILVWQD
ncbi:MAG: protein NO VEIN domain-containing protein [Muribaculaceae bacterium]